MNYFRFILISLSCCFSVQSLAQKFSLGAKIGGSATFTNFADKSTRDSLKSGIKPGFSMGGFIIFPLKHRTSFQVEGGFSKSGRSWTYKPNSSKWTSTYNFIDLSMSLKRSFTLRIFRNVPSEWYIGAGPNINYWLGGKGKWVPHLGPDTPPGIISNFKVVFDNPNPPLGSHLTNIYVNRENRWLYGINLSIGTSWTTLKNQRFFTELRLMWGQTYLGKKDSELLGSPEAAPQMSLKCNLKTLSFSIGYIFDRDIQRGKMGKSTKKLK